MEEVIKQIIDIEDKAQSIIDNALIEKKQKEEEHMRKLDELERKIVDDALIKVAQIREREFNDIEDEENAKVRRCEDRLLELNEYAEENMDRWVKELVDKVLS